MPGGSLNAALNAFEAACAREWPPEAVALVNQTRADLAQTGIQEAVLRVGDVAPRFTLPDQEGRPVYSQELPAKGPLVLVCEDQTTSRFPGSSSLLILMAKSEISPTPHSAPTQQAGFADWLASQQMTSPSVSNVAKSHDASKSV